MTQSATPAPRTAAVQPVAGAPDSSRTRRLATSSTTTMVLAAVAVTGSAGAAHADDSYVVRSGDTVSHIAQRTGVSVSAIARANALDTAARIRAGQLLTIPSATSGSAAAATPAAAPAARYTVVKGDTVSHIAAAHGTTVAAVVAANGLDSRAFIRVGQQLALPGTASAAAAPVVAAATPAAPASARTHTVATGETVGKIAAGYGTTVAAVVAANGLDSRAFIRVGQTLSIPGQQASPSQQVQLVGNTFAGRTYAASVVSSANVNLSALRATAVPTKAQMQAAVVETARAMGVDTSLAQAVAFQESGFRHDVVSPANAIGVMQVIPSSGEWASQLVGRQLNLLDPADNVVAGVAILRALVKNTELPSAIAGYYQGASSVKRNGMYADTRRYVANVQTHMARFS